LGAASGSARGQSEAAGETGTGDVPPVWVTSVPASIPPYAYRGPGTDYARGPDARLMPDYCYPGSLLPGAEEGPGLSRISHSAIGFARNFRGADPRSAGSAAVGWRGWRQRLAV